MDLYLLSALYLLLATATLAISVVGDMACPDNALQHGPSSRQANIRVYISLTNSFSDTPITLPMCRLQVTTGRGSTLFQTMKLANYQHAGKFSFTPDEHPDLMKGNTVKAINGLVAMQTAYSSSSWILYDGKTGNQITQGIDYVFVNDGDSFIWDYIGDDSSLSETPYTGDCLRQRSNIKATRNVNYAIFYLSVQFWSTVWPLCKLPIIIMDKTSVTLNDTMSFARRQHSSSFIFSTYTNNKLYQINDLHAHNNFQWKAWKGAEELPPTELNKVPLEDGDHVIWRFVDDDGNARIQSQSDTIEGGWMGGGNMAGMTGVDTIVLFICFISCMLYNLS